MRRSSDVAFLGVGVGLRPKHYPRILETPEPARLGVDFFEAISENYMVPGGRPLRVLEEGRGSFPVVLHGVSLTVGWADPLAAAYLPRAPPLPRPTALPW